MRAQQIASIRPAQTPVTAGQTGVVAYQAEAAQASDIGGLLEGIMPLIMMMMVMMMMMPMFKGMSKGFGE